jgi:hypothetical protein
VINNQFCSRFPVERVFLDHTKWISVSGRKEQKQKAVHFWDEMCFFGYHQLAPASNISREVSSTNKESM